VQALPSLDFSLSLGLNHLVKQITILLRDTGNRLTGQYRIWYDLRMKQLAVGFLIGMTLGTAAGVYSEHKRTLYNQQQVLFCLARSPRCMMTLEEFETYVGSLLND